jgi:hypothetical protein
MQPIGWFRQWVYSSIHMEYPDIDDLLVATAPKDQTIPTPHL